MPTSDLAAGLATFDAGRAKCFLDEDKQRLWAVIEASFGTFAPFNALVRDIFSHGVDEPAAAAPKPTYDAIEAFVPQETAKETA